MNKLTSTTLVATALLAGAQANAAVLLPAETFEDGTFGSWTSGGAAIYTYASDPDYAPGGDRSVEITAGDTFTSPVLTLSTLEADDVTLSWDYEFVNSSSTRWIDIEVSLDGGSTWLDIARHHPSAGTTGSASVTLSETGTAITVSGVFAYSGYTGQALTDTTVFRFNHQRDTSRVYVDNITVTSETATPEPGSLALLGLGGLCLLNRRRRG